MATIADFRLPLESFPLGGMIDANPALRIELERIVPAEEGIVPFFWVWGCGEFEDFERRVLETEAVRALESLSHTETGTLYRTRWNPDVEGILNGIGRTGATILDGRGTNEGWRFELRFSSRSAIREFQRYCTEYDVPIRLNRLYTVRDVRQGEQYQLTDDQRETLQRAYARGYFEEPQTVTQTELAEEFGISQRAVSRRLRRGLSRLLGSTIGPQADDRGGSRRL